MADDHHSRRSLGPHGIQRRSVRGDRGAPDAEASRIPAGFRGLAVSSRAAFGGICSTRVSPFAAHSHIREALFGVGAATLLLLFVGIHNAWDAVAYHVFVHMRDTESERHQDKTSEEGVAMTQGIKDKVIVITGASDGPGEACIRHLARHRRSIYYICFDDVRGYPWQKNHREPGIVF